MHATYRALAALALVALMPGEARPQAPQIAAKWLGQDGKDFVGGEPGPAKSEFQDIHVAVRGLPASREIAEVTIKGAGQGEWRSNVSNRFAVHVVRDRRSTAADLYFEPYRREDGRTFEVHVKFDDGQESVAYIPSGRADPNLRVPGAGVEVKWVGQDGQDRTGPGACVGPDGSEDVHLALARLSPKGEIKSVEVAAPGKFTWQTGLNPKGHASAELDRKADDPTRAEVYFSPARDLAGQTLKVTITYGDERSDSATVAAGKCNPAKPAARPPAPTLTTNTAATARWLGQDGVETTPGDVHVAIEGLSPGRQVAAAALSDGVAGTWIFRPGEKPAINAGSWVGRLNLKRTDPTRIDLAFPPVRDESGSTMTLRLVDPSGREEIIRFPGGKADPALRALALPAGSAVAKPGDDIQGLVGRFGTVTLAPGVHDLAKPLILDRPARIVGDGASTLRFSQAADRPPWTAAIKIHAGGTTLEGFALRFAGPIRWDRSVGHGPALIGATDDRDKPSNDPKHGLNFLRLDIQGPPPSSVWEEAPHTIRAINASGGRIERCILKGGAVLFTGGPWSIVDNDCRGTVPGTFCRNLFAGRYTHDVVIARNHARDEGPSGKTWRFLVFAQRGACDVVRDNVVEGGFGPREDDPHPDDNAPELILTEAYRLHFEGKPASISADGRVLTIPAPQGGPAETGDAVAILSGPEAGQWRAIAQPLGPTSYLLDEPIARETDAVSIATGFVRQAFEGNKVDCRGSGIAMNLALAGNQFGVRVVRNHFIGGRQTVTLSAFPTESPGIWGWSHAPFLGGVFEGNTVEDSGMGGSIGVDHTRHIKSNKGRVYLTVALKDNTIRRTAAARDRTADGKPIRLVIGNPDSLDPGELVVTEQGTKAEGIKDAYAWVHAAILNGRPVRETPLKARP